MKNVARKLKFKNFFIKGERMILKQTQIIVRYMMMSVAIYLFLSVGVAQATFQYDTNLITNGDAEDSLNGWTKTGGFDVMGYGTSGYPDVKSPGPQNRGAYFFYGGNEASSSAEQAIDISGGATAIDAGQVRCELSAYLGGYSSQEDNAMVMARFMSASDTMISSTQVGPVSSSDREDITGLLYKSVQQIIPAGTRTIVIQIDIKRDEGTDSDGYADNISLTLSQIENTETKEVWDSWVYGVDTTTSATNNGASDYLAGYPISNCNTANAIAYIKFDLSSYPDTVDKVNLVVEHLPHTNYCYSNCQADFYFYPVLEPWDEMTITYNNRPTLDTTPVYGPINISFPNDLGQQKYDITDLYRKWKSGSLANYGLAIYSPTVGCNNAAASFLVYSSENTSHPGPSLEIVSQNASLLMPLPTSQEIMPGIAPGVSPVIDIVPAKANPLGFGTAASGGTTLSLTAGISDLSGPADLYLGISLGTEIYLFDNDNNLYPLSDGMVKWRANTTGGINERILPDIDMSAFPGTYTFYFFMTPAGHMDNFRLWAIPLVIGGSDNLTKSRTIALGQDVSGPLGDDILTVLSNTGENSISSVGSDSIDFLHDESNHPNPTLLIAYNTAGNPVLLKLSDDPSDDFTVDSTALALVLYDPNILLLPHEDFNRVRTAVEANSRLRSLTADILALIKAKDPNPLDYDTHPELYQEAVAIAQDALGNIFADADGQFSGFQGSSDKTPLEVVDDKDHTTPEVALTNRTMCYYEIKATRDGNPLSQSPYEIERRNLLDYHLTKWPPGLDYEVTSKVGAGDGKLSFQFQKRKKLSVFYCMMSAASTAIGVGSTKLADIEKGAEALASAGGEIVSLMNKALATTPNNKAEADKLAYDLIYGVFHSGYTLVTTVYETQIKNELKHKFFQTAFKIFSSKMIVWATTSYAAGDIAATLWDLHHAPDNYSEEGYQVNGEYPVRLTITNVDPGKGKPGDMITVDFENSIPSAILPVKLMLGEKEVGKIFDGNQRQIIFTVPDGAKTGTLKLSYGIAESNGVVFTVGDPATTIPGSISGKSHTVVISDHSPENDAVKMAVSANWKIDNATTAATVSSSDGFTSLLGYSDVRTTTLLFQLEESNNFLVQTRGNFTITLNNTPIEGVQAMYLDWQGYGWANVTFGKPFYSMDTSQLCSKVSPLKESGITFNIAQNGDVIIGDYYFPGSGEGAVVPVLLNVPYTCYGKNASGNDETWTGVWKTEIDLKFRNYKPFEYSGHCPCD